MAQETEPPVTEEAPSPKSGLVRMLLLAIPVALLSACVGGWLAFSQYPVMARTAMAVGLDFGLEEKHREEQPETYGHFEELKDLLVNPAGTDGKRFLMVSLGLESQAPEVFAELKEKDIVVRDMILRVLGRKTIMELSSIEKQDETKRELRQAINKVLEKGQVDRLYFTQYILQ